MTLFSILKLLHVVSAMWLVSGLLGRAVALAAARRATQMPLLKAIADVSGRFENLMIAPGFPAVLITGIATALVGGYSLLGPFADGPLWVFIPLVLIVIVAILTPIYILPRDRAWGRSLEEAARQGVVTQAVRADLGEGLLARRHVPEFVIIGLIVVLMVLKPF